MPSKIHSIELSGLDGHLVEIEVDTRRTLPAFVIVGLPDTAVQEAKERVKSAIKNTGFQLPRGKVIVNLAPADLKKVGPRYDLPIALGIISTQVNWDEDYFKHKIFLGELALDGSVRGITGILASIETAKKRGFKQIFVPEENAKEAALISGIQIVPVSTLEQATMYLDGALKPKSILQTKKIDKKIDTVDMASIKGQLQAKRALEIAAAGGHNLILNGPPGAGKTLMAKALQGILPQMTQEEMLEVTKIYSIAGLLKKDQVMITQRPFRPVHHTASAISVVGGGRDPLPGEITLAHRGILFLDEIAEFPKDVLEVLRQPMEDKQITISRARASVTYPARFTLMAAMNPCPCGYYNQEKNGNQCQCPAWKIERYNKKLSGPLLDRMDMHLNVEAVKCQELMETHEAESSAAILERVMKAFEIQKRRFKNLPFHQNGEMDSAAVKQFCKLDDDSKTMLETAVDRFKLSARAYFKVIKLARTIADLAGNEEIESIHLGEALQYRSRSTV